MKWIPVEAGLPRVNTYVLVLLNNDNWIDEDDPERVYCKVARFVVGLSLKERAALPDGDPRKCQYRAEDQWDNNQLPYYWREFGPGSMFGPEVSHWLPILLPGDDGVLSEARGDIILTEACRPYWYLSQEFLTEEELAEWDLEDYRYLPKTFEYSE